MSGPVWTEAMDSILRTMVAQGISYSKIARMVSAVGIGVSRSAAISRARRIGLTRTPGVSRKARELAWERADKRKPLANALAKSKPAKARAEGAPKRGPCSVRFIDRTPRQCPYFCAGEEGPLGFVCGARVDEGKAWCRDCETRVFDLRAKAAA